MVCREAKLVKRRNIAEVGGSSPPTATFHFNKMTQDQLYFWLQYDGMVRAIDLPMEYKVKDRRICCVNKNCTNALRDKCLFWQRFRNYGKIIGSEAMRWAFTNTKIYQKGIEREKWDKNYGKPNYFSAAFFFMPEQKGIKCEYYKSQI